MDSGSLLGPLYNDRQRQHSVNVVMMLGTSLIENNGVAPEWGCNTFWSDSVVLNERNVAVAVLAIY